MKLQGARSRQRVAARMSTQGIARPRGGMTSAASASPLPFGDVSFGHLCSRGRPLLDGALLGDENGRPVRPQARRHWRARGEHEGNTYRNCSKLGLCAFDCSGGRLSVPHKRQVDVRDVPPARLLPNPRVSPVSFHSSHTTGSPPRGTRDRPRSALLGQGSPALKTSSTTAPLEKWITY
jgi:hypothetical protein